MTELFFIIALGLLITSCGKDDQATAQAIEIEVIKVDIAREAKETLGDNDNLELKLEIDHIKTKDDAKRVKLHIKQLKQHSRRKNNDN